MMPWERYQAQQASPPSSLADAGKSFAGGLERGAAAAVMTLPNLMNAAAAGPQLLGRGIAEGVDKLIGVQPQPRGELWQPFYSSEEALKGLPEPLQPHEPQTAAGKVSDFVGQIAGSVGATKGMQAAEPGVKALLKDQSSGKPPPPPQATADDIKGLSNQAYASAEQQGGLLTPQFTDKFLNEVGKMQPQTQAGKMLAGDSAVTKIAEKMQGLKGRPLSLREAQEIDEFLGDAIDDFTTLGVVNKQGRKLLDMQSNFRRMIDDATPADVVGSKAGFESLKEGRRLWASQARLRDIEKIIARAEMTDNPATAIKTGFRNLYTNPARIRGFSDEERGLIKNAAESGMVGDLLRIAGSRLNPIITTATGAGGLGGAAASQAASMAARGAATKVQVSKAEKVANTVANNAVNPPAPAPAQQPVLRPAAAAVLGGEAAEANAPAPPPSQPWMRYQKAAPADAATPAGTQPQAEAPADIKAAEGVKPQAYNDHLGNRTIGIGFNMDDPSARERWKQAKIPTSFDAAYQGKASLSPEEMERLALADALTAKKDVKRLVPNFGSLSPNRQAALVQMAYQLGGPRLAEFKPTLKLVNEGKYDLAADRLLKSDYAKQTPERVQMLAKMLAKDVPYGM